MMSRGYSFQQVTDLINLVEGSEAVRALI